MKATRWRTRGTLGASARWIRQSQRVGLAGLLALSACMLLMLADAAGAVPESLFPRTPLHAPSAHAVRFTTLVSEATTPVSTPTPQPPSVQLVSPSSAQGPVGAHLTITGQNLGSSETSVAVYGSAQSDCQGAQTALGSAPISGGTMSNFAFLWPNSLSGGTFYICVNGLTSGAPSYHVLSSAPPALSLSAATVQANSQVTIRGRNFLGLPAGATIGFTATVGGMNTPFSDRAVVSPDGTFAIVWTPSGNPAGSVTIVAYSTPEGGASDAVLQASAQLQVVAQVTPSPSPVLTPSPIVVTTSIPTPNPKGAQNGGDSIGIVLAIIGIIAALLVLLGVVAYLVLRGRGGGPEGEFDDGRPAGYGGTGQVAQYGQSATGRYANVGPGQYGRPGPYDMPDDPYGNTVAGNVSAWDDPDEGPGPDWQPRPMTGYGAGARPLNPAYPQYAPDSQDPPTDAGSYSPTDPWENPARGGGDGQPASGPRGFNPSGPNSGSAATRAAVPPSGRSAARDGWDDGAPDAAWGNPGPAGGSGATRPGDDGGWNNGSGW